MISVVPAYLIPLVPHIVTIKFIPTGCRIGIVQLVALAGISCTHNYGSVILRCTGREAHVVAVFYDIGGR